MENLTYFIINIAITVALINLTYLFVLYDIKWWLRVNRSKNLLDNHFNKRVLLELKVPREVTKSPVAMEVFLGTIANQTIGHSVKGLMEKAKADSMKGDKFPGYLSNTFIVNLRKYLNDKYFKGGLRGWFSLEIISEEGKIRFFVYTYDKLADYHKNAIYAQYPGVEVVEVEDYTLNHHYKPGGDLDLYVGNWKLKKADYLPIKTYVDYGMDKDPKDEFKIDPLYSMLETMATAGKGEHFWFQILVRSTIKDDWKDEGRKRIDEILGIKRYGKDDPEVLEKKAKEKDIREQKYSMLNISPENKKEIEIITRNIEKDGLDCFVRFFGLKYKQFEKDKMSVSKNILPIVYSMKPFDSVGYNSFSFDTITVDSDYAFLDPKSEWTNKRKEQNWENYVMRAGFYFEGENFPPSPWVQWKVYWQRRRALPTREWANGFLGAVKEYWELHEIHPKGMNEYIMSTEEVATMFHLPSRTAATTNSVIDSNKSDPPLNLPL